MATRIIPKKSSVASKVPLSTDLVQGEIAINLTDKKIYTKDNNDTIVELGISVKFDNWDIIETNGDLYFKQGGVNKMKLDASGNLQVVGNVETNATIT